MAPTNRNPPTSNRQLLIILGIFLSMILGIIWLLGLIVDNLVWIIPPNVEKQLGALVIPTYEKLSQPLQTQDTLNQLLNKLESHLPSEQRNRDYQILYVPNETVNALALPGDRIVIFSGLIKQAESENELMMVLGHELGHFSNRDHLRSILRQLILPITLASITGNNDLLVSLASSVTTFSDAKYSQAQELEADKIGLNLLYKTYGHVGGATDFFQRLSKEQSINIAFLSTHPAPQERVKNLQKLIKNKHYKVEKLSPLSQKLKSLR